MRLRIIEKLKAARVSKSDVESLHGIRVPECLMVMLRKHCTNRLLPSSVLLDFISCFICDFCVVLSVSVMLKYLWKCNISTIVKFPKD